MFSGLTLGEIYNAAIQAVKKRGLAVFVFALIMRVLLVVSIFVTAFAMFVYMDTADTVDGEWTSIYSITFAAVLSVFFAVFNDVLVTAFTVIVEKNTVGQTLVALLKRLPKLFFAACIAAAAYFLIFIIVYVIFGTVIMNFNPVAIAAMVYEGSFFAIVVVVAVICGLLLLAVNSVMNFFVPLLANDVPFMLSLDSSFGSVLNLRHGEKVLVYNIFGKIVVVGFYIIVYIVLSAVLNWPLGFLGNAPIEGMLANVLNFVMTFIFATLLIPYRKNVIAKMAAITGEISLRGEKTSDFGKHFVAVAIDTILLAAVLGGAFFGLISFISRNTPDFALTISIGVLPFLLVAAVFAASLVAFNVLIRKFLGGRFVGKRLMGVSFNELKNEEKQKD